VIDQAGIRAQALRRYEEYLSILAAGDPAAAAGVGPADGRPAADFFPVEIRFGKVKSGEASARWADLRDELRALREGSDEGGARSYRVEWEERVDRLAGTQRFPVRVFFPDAASLLSYLGKTREAERFVRDIGLIGAAVPELRLWAAKKPLRVVEHFGDWGRLAAVVRWMRAHPRPGIFAREVPAVEDTKFIERKKAVLRELLDLSLSETEVSPEASSFEDRFGLRKSEPLVRAAILDDVIARARFSGIADLSVPVSSLGTLLVPELTSVLVFENKASFSNADAFLTLPALRGCAALFGSGFAVGAVRAVPELAGKRLFYWGDIDTQGLRILSVVRGRFPGCRSVLMDEETFDRFPEYRTDAPEETAEEPRALDAAELALYRRLAAMPAGNRLEQERIPLSWARERLTLMFSES